MEFTDIAKRRLASQHLIGPKLRSHLEIVRHQGAVQSQDFAGAKWGIAQRASVPLAEADAVIDAALADGSIVRTHAMRPTWHFVAATDLRDLLSLTGPRVQKGNAGFATHGPATMADFAWWSGLTMTDGKRGVELAGTALAQIDIEGTPYFGPAKSRRAGGAEPAVHLLPNYDEALGSYKDTCRWPAGFPRGRPIPPRAPAAPRHR